MKRKYLFLLLSALTLNCAAAFGQTVHYAFTNFASMPGASGTWKALAARRGSTARNNELKMKSKNLFLLPALIAGAGLIMAGRITAQTLTTLHSFTNCTDGAHPAAELILSGNTLYGTAAQGGRSGYGTLFAVNTDGTGFTILHSFASSDGASPQA